MYKEFDKCVERYNNDFITTACLWEEEGFINAFKLLEEFTNQDWNELINNLPSKSNVWKKRLAYCMIFIDEEPKKKILLSMIDTEDIKLFETILLAFVEGNVRVDEYLEKIVNRIKYFTPKSGKIVKDTFKMFLEKQKDMIQGERKTH